MAVDLTKSRQSLPAPMLDRSSYSIFSVIKQAIGKDLTKFSIPVVWNEPLSFLQRLAECLEYSSLLDRAALAQTSLERFHFISSFITSNLSTHLERMSKPFNPLLGETYELKNEGNAPFHYIAEQVSHHPPISAVHVRGDNWNLTANVEPKVKFQGTNVVALSEGRWVLRLGKSSIISRSESQSSFHSCTDEDEETAEEYVWTVPPLVIHNILFGRLWCEFQGQITLERTQSTEKAILTIKSHSWFTSTKAADIFKFTGFIYDGNIKLGAFHGNYGHCYYAIDDLNDAESKSSSSCSAEGNNSTQLNSNSTLSSPCDLMLTPSSRLVWHRSFSFNNSEEPISRSQYYFFTPFTLCLNEQRSSSTLPLTDSRFRQDIRFLENGDLEAAAVEKQRLEEEQRADKRKREMEFQPLWFEKTEQQEYIYTGDYDGRDFSRCPNLFSPPSLS